MTTFIGQNVFLIFLSLDQEKKFTFSSLGSSDSITNTDFCLP